jgi:hypothetical protein
MNRLDIIATLIHPCPPPDIAGGYDMCPCGLGCSWPCPKTRAAWLARGLDPDTEISKVTARVKAETEAPDFDPGGWDSGPPDWTDWC